MEARVARLEANVDHIQRDVTEIKGDLRSMFKFGIVAFLITWGGIITSAMWLAGKIDAVAQHQQTAAEKQR